MISSDIVVFFVKFRMKYILEIEACNSSNEERLSPVQCAVYLPEPAYVERDKINGRLLRIDVMAL
jgi:hypothetical protein